MRRAFATGLAWAALAATGAARAAVLDPAMTETTFATTALTNVTGMGWVPDGTHRLFLTRKTGQVRIVENGVLLATPFATVTPIQTSSECGLIGMAFAPDFATSGHVYFLVTVSMTEQQVIRYTAAGNVGADKATIIAGLPTRGANHDGGGIGFGPDGKLYWAIGDLGNFTGIDQDLTLLAAKIGRANRDGSTPSDNPFFDGPGPNEDRIWARGFRNPFTLTWQPSTERMWINVVGSSYEQVFTPVAGDHVGYNDYENTQPTGSSYLAPAIAYRTGSAEVRTIASQGATRSGSVATFTLVGNTRLRLGAKVTIGGVTDPSFDGTGYVTALPSDTELSLPQAGPDAQSGGGTATTLDVGRAITGGTFWDSSAAPPAYRGNFFFGDYVSGRMVRATLGSSNTVASVDLFSDTLGGCIDMDVGPDGALYSVNYAGLVRKVLPSVPAPGLVVTPLHARVDEGSGRSLFVRLATAPGGPVIVSSARASGDPDVTVASGGSVGFDPTNWSTPRPLTISAAEDADSVDDAAVVDVSAPGLGTESVVLRVTDDDALGLVVSTTSVTLAEGGTVTFDVSLTGPPPSPMAVTVARSSGDVDVTVQNGASLSFDSGSWSAPQTVTIAAGDDADTIDDSATIAVSVGGLPSRAVAVTATDDEASAPSITTTPLTSAVVGAPYAYDVDATGLPAPAFSLDAAPLTMIIDATTGLVTWTPPLVGSSGVTVRAANGVLPDATQTFTIDVAVDIAPTCSLIAPIDGAAIGGAMAEFFGDVLDDVPPVRAEFSIDGTVAYVDTAPGGHYHFGGSHNLFDTTLVADGQHVLRMTGYDTSGQSCFDEVTVTIGNAAIDAGADVAGDAMHSDATGAGGSPTTDAAEGGPADASAGAGGTGPAGAAGASGASGGNAKGGNAAASDAGITPGASSGSGSPEDGGCSCGTPSTTRWPASALASALGGVMLASARRRRRRFERAIRTTASPSQP